MYYSAYNVQNRFIQKYRLYCNNIYFLIIFKANYQKKKKFKKLDGGLLGRPDMHNFFLILTPILIGYLLLNYILFWCGDVLITLSGGMHFMASNNDCGVREYDMVGFQLVNHFRFLWPVNVSFL